MVDAVTAIVSPCRLSVATEDKPSSLAPTCESVHANPPPALVPQWRRDHAYRSVAGSRGLPRRPPRHHHCCDRPASRPPDPSFLMP